MEMQRAIEIIEQYQARYQLIGFLEALEEMRADLEAGDIRCQEALAYRVFMNAGRAMFA